MLVGVTGGIGLRMEGGKQASEPRFGLVDWHLPRHTR
jgi:hypothetical protein